MIDPKSVLIATPTIDGKVAASFAGGLMSCAAAQCFGNFVAQEGCADIGLSRNIIANRFLIESRFDWLVFIDSDIGFSRRDFSLLMDYPPVFLTDDWQVWNPQAMTEQTDTTVNTFGEALVVCAEYARKVPDVEPVAGGLGFTRIHRGVFERLLDATDDEGKPRIGHFRHKGADLAHFFPVGPGFEGRWFGEDLGFFYICALIGIKPRRERRTRLVHYGTMPWVYDGEYESVSLARYAVEMKKLEQPVEKIRYPNR